MSHGLDIAVPFQLIMPSQLRSLGDGGVSCLLYHFLGLPNKAAFLLGLPGQGWEEAAVTLSSWYLDLAI